MYHVEFCLLWTIQEEVFSARKIMPLQGIFSGLLLFSLCFIDQPSVKGLKDYSPHK